MHISGPRDVIPLPGREFDDLLDVFSPLSKDDERYCKKVLRRIMSKAEGQELDVVQNEERSLPPPFDETNDPEVVGWLKANWHGKTL